MDLPAAWLQGISLRSLQQEKPELARGGIKSTAADPKAPVALSATQNGSKPAEGTQSTDKMYRLLLSQIWNIG